jgi:2-dehydro-3-deoxyphosphooctonate aldolase (KDO 8-P synthase)
VVNIKKGQFMNPVDMEYSALKVLKTRDCDEATYQNSLEKNLWLTERGSSFGYGNLVVDMRSLMIMREFAPVIFDATHAVQMPGGAGGKSSGKREFVAPLARAAAAVGVDGFFFETHYDPSVALSDGPNMLTLQDLEKTVDAILKIQAVI